MTLVPDPRLTDRQREVLLIWAATGSYKGTAHALGISPSTVKQTLSNARARLGVATSVQAVAMVLAGPPETATDGLRSARRSGARE